MDGEDARPPAVRRRRHRADQPHAVDFARRQQPGVPRGDVRPRCVAAYREHVRGLVDGGADLLLLETIFDTLNAKAAIVAILDVFEEKGVELPLMISVTITDRSGRTLSGQTLDAFYVSIRHARPFSVGLNCALGAREMRPYLAELARIAETYVTCYPNAGLPNAFGQYDELPDETAALLRDFAESGFVNIVGGCCGTTPDHIAAIAAAVASLPPRPESHRIPNPGSRIPDPDRLHPALRARDADDPPREQLPDDRRADQRHRVEAIRAAGHRRRLRRGGARGARPGARRREHPRRQHGRRDARFGSGDDDVPQLHRHRARDRARADHGRQLEVDRARGRPEVRPGQGRRQLDQPEGRRRGLPAEGADRAPLRRRGRRHGVRRAGPGGHGGPQGRDLPARVHAAHRAGGLRSARHHLRSQHPRDCHRPRRAQRVRDQLHRGDPDHQGDAARA